MTQAKEVKNKQAQNKQQTRKVRPAWKRFLTGLLLVVVLLPLVITLLMHYQIEHVLTLVFGYIVIGVVAAPFIMLLLIFFPPLLYLSAFVVFPFVWLYLRIMYPERSR